MKSPRQFLSLASSAIFLLAAGCNPPAAPKAGAPAASHAEHAHTHAGPHGGHVMVVGDEEYHAEWTHDESGKVTFYILDASGKKDVPIAADEIVIDVKIGTQEPKTYKLAALSPLDGKASAFELVDKGLLGVLESLSTGVTATIQKLPIGSKTFENVKIEEEQHGAEHKH